jgi:hypothetical protein
MALADAAARRTSIKLARSSAAYRSELRCAANRSGPRLPRRRVPPSPAAEHDRTARLASLHRPQAPAVLRQHLADVVDVLGRMPDVVIEVRPDRLVVSPPALGVARVHMRLSILVH